ncbi:DEAD/DEAH box helicase [Pelistega europaea]|uniref:AAA family ATPase n=1 Tax=Pelistega europaea TaxID=106147 RepID=A0A7Y4LDS5_9BURK|nr:AAA domain-containing protein [Pelistega europaea]NOL50366.1 AAA family ATPase [Pelistega europaea]
MDEKTIIIIAGLVVLASATAIDWLYDINTEEEKERQKQAEERRQKNLQELEKAQTWDAIARQKHQRTLADAQAQFLKKNIQERRTAVASIPEDLQHIRLTIDQEINDKTSSPYRKSALRREYARLEDAFIRLEEYRRYLDYMEVLIDDFVEQENFEQLIGLPPINSSLPLEWLYPGKLVLVSMSEVGKELAPFNHTISFGREYNTQNALALKYGDDIPVLIKSVHKEHSHLFYGCVARGEIYYHHILPEEPIEFVVDRIKGKNARGFLCDGMVPAHLPLDQLKHPGLKLLTGQKILVFPSAYDLTLHKNPFNPDGWGIEVSQFNYATKSAQQYQQLYISIQEHHLRQITDDAFWHPNEHWTLLAYIPATGMISLAKSSVRIDCQVSNDLSLLEVQQVTQGNHLSVGLDTPFSFILIDHKLARAEQIGWDYGIKEFLHFCTQAMRDLSDSPIRLAQARFYQHWERVIAYQRNLDENTVLTFPLSIADYDLANNTLTISKALLPEPFIDHFNQLYPKLKEVLDEESSLRPEYCIHLDYWDKERADYVPATRYDYRPPLYTSQEGRIKIEGSFLFNNDADCMLRLVVSIPSVPLKRQEQALEDFSMDRMVNPALKNILLAPENYLPNQEEISTDIAWSTQLDESQKDVVRLALREPNIALIQGPPGAGKTTAIVEILYQLFLRNPHCRVLVVSQQNTAVDNALSKFLEKHQSRFSSSLQAIRIGNQDKMSASVQTLSFNKQYNDFISQLNNSAIQAATHLAGDEQTLCYSWYAKLTQLSQNPKGQEELFITLLNNRNLVGATCVGLATNKGGIDQLQFDVAIIDEAGRATVPEILIPILRSRKVVLVGDHYQLPPSIAPMLRDDEATQALEFLQENFFEESFFELMFNRLPAECKETLNKQYRMAPDIGNLVANLFYSPQGKRRLFNGLSDTHFDSQYLLEKSIYWVDVKGTQKQCGTSKSNELEAFAIADFLKILSKRDYPNPISVAVITPYSAQKHCIRRILGQIGWNMQDEKLGAVSVAVDTVDAFQGSEADIVCYSTVRTEGNLNFILDKKRLNVACSRARRHLLFFGHRHHLQKWQSKNKEEVNLFHQIMKYASFDKVVFKN